MINSLNPSQREAVFHTDGHLLVIAGAGSGKTRVITAKITYLIEKKSVSPYSILAITFTNKASEEMKARITPLIDKRDQKLLNVRTFHSFGAMFLRAFIDELPGYDRNFSIIDSEDQFKILKDICKTDHPKLDQQRYFQRLISTWKNDFLYLIEDAKEGEFIIDKETKMRFSYYDTGPFLLEEVLNIYSRYQFYLKQHNLLDFDDLLALTAKLLKENKRCHQYATNRWKYLLVDEYQDTNITQEHLLEYFASGGSIITAVGDDDQSIYSFRGANIDNILNFPQKYPESKVIKLEKNYRSTDSILNLANHIIKNNPRVYDKKLFTDNPSGELPFAHYLYNDNEESRFIAEDIHHRVENEKHFAYRDIAVFYRTNYQSRGIEEQLLRKDIPYQIIGGLKFYQRKEIKDIMGYLHLLINPRDINAFKRIINYPARGLGEKSRQKIEQFLFTQTESSIVTVCEEKALLNQLPKKAKTRLMSFTSLIRKYSQKLLEAPTSFLGELIKESGINDHLRSITDPFEKEQRLGNVEQFIQSAQEFEPTDPSLHLIEFIQDAALKSDLDQMEDQENCVKLMTVHNAKGLEFPLVFLSGMTDNHFPHSLSRTNEDIQEERRLFYVAVTRAKKELVITASHYQGRWQESTSPSRFLLEIDEVNLARSENLKRRKKNGLDHVDEFDQYLDEDHDYYD